MRKLLTYSLVKALYDRGKDYIDCFWPFVIGSMPRDKRHLAPEAIADAVQRKYGLTIPVHTIRTLADRARKKHGFLSRKESTYALTAEGEVYIQGQESERQVERRLQALVAHASIHIGESFPDFQDAGYTQRMISQVIEANHAVFEFVVERPRPETDQITKGAEKAIFDYFCVLEDSEPNHFETLRDLILGSTLSGLLKRDDISDATKRFGKTTLFLDTNVLLSLLGLRFETQCRPTNELLSLLNRESHFKLKVFDFTLSELTGLLRGYTNSADMYIPEARVNSLYASLRYRNYTPGDIALLIRDIDDELKKYGINIEVANITPDGDVPNGQKDLETLRGYKPEQDRQGQLHDLAAISEVARLRKHAVRKVEDAQAFFLTEDGKLASFAFLERGHQTNNTISEVMPDRLLTNLLWLKNPESLHDLPVATVIAIHSRDLFIDRRVWGRFHTELTTLVKTGDIPDEAASALLYDAQVHQDLAGIGTGELRSVDRGWLLDRLDDARERSRDKAHAELRGEVGQVKASYAVELDKKDQDIDDLSETVVKLKQKVAAERSARDRQKNMLEAQVKAQATRAARITVLVLKGIILMAIGLVVIVAWSALMTVWVKFTLEAGLATLLITVVVGALGIGDGPGRVSARLEGRIANKLIARGLENLNRCLVEPTR